MQPFYSILVVSLNPGEKIRKTLESIQRQTFSDYEVIVKDGESGDDTPALVQRLSEQDPRIRLVVKKDTGIYAAMNQAVEEAQGKYVYFLNCGDFFCENTVLEQMAAGIDASGKGEAEGIFYGNIFERLTGQQVISNPQIDAFACYRNVPCHQACFYDRRLLKAHPFQTCYRVRADYEQFLWCFFSEREVAFCYLNLLIADYEGGGFSETKENRRISQKEHRQITEKYFPAGQLFRYRLIMGLTLSPLRTKIAENEKTAGIYNRLKKLLYLRKNPR